MAGSENFYRELEPVGAFAEVGELQYYAPVPDDWCVLIGDVADSTAAIRDGRYKAVNMTGAAVITAVLNAAPDVDIPYVFGGDGGTLVVPPSAEQAGREALARLQAHARDFFDLELRAGAIPVAALRAVNQDVRIMKLQLSEGNDLAMFAGGGLAFADLWLKRAEDDDPIRIEPAVSHQVRPPDLDGLSCRWQPLKSQRGMILTLITVGAGRGAAGERAHFRSVTGALVEILGAPLELAAPVSDASLEFQFPPAGLVLEARATAGRKWPLRRKAEIVAQAVLQWWCERRNTRIGYYDAPAYRREMRHNTDFQKYDGMLRLVLDVTAEQATRIDIYLRAEHEAGRLNYGVHLAPEALMTCVVFSLKDSRHIHFIDGASGGFAMAAVDLKKQLGAGQTAAKP